MKDDGRDPNPTVTLRPSGDARRSAPAGRVHVVHPTGLARVLDLPETPLLLGRSVAWGEARLEDQTVSREHVRIHWDGRMNAHAAADLGSHNGTWLDGLRLEQAPVALRDNAVLRLGGVVLVYERASPDDVSPGDALADQIPGEAREVRRLRAQIARAAPDPSPALIVGETGVGKEHVARALHDASRRTGPFVPVNVSELAPQLVESQLFGHVRGAFTGAERANEGLFVAAQGGTLFLDEIGELPPELQPKLLRALQEREVRAVGATRAQRIDVRVVAATNRPLAADVARGAFRRDLYARLALWELAVPALRDRRADVLGWIARFHDRWGAERGLRARRFEWTPEAAEALVLHAWPENLRGIDRLVHHLAHMAGTGPLDAAAVRPLLGAPDDAPDDPTASLDEPGSAIKRAAPETREELEAALARFDGSVRAVARWYGRDRRQVYRWFDAFGITRDPSSS